MFKVRVFIKKYYSICITTCAMDIFLRENKIGRCAFLSAKKIRFCVENDQFLLFLCTIELFEPVVLIVICTNIGLEI